MAFANKKPVADSRSLGMPPRPAQGVDQRIASSIKDYRKQGYLSRNDITERLEGHDFSPGRWKHLFDNPCVILGNAFLYHPDRADAILFEIAPGTRFNKLAFLFITGKYQRK